mgnify:CR=1 FL=1
MRIRVTPKRDRCNYYKLNTSEIYKFSNCKKLTTRTTILREISSTRSDKTSEIPADNERRSFCKSTKASVAPYIRQIRHEPFTRHARMAERARTFVSTSKSAGVSRLAAFWRIQNREERSWKVRLSEKEEFFNCFAVTQRQTHWGERGGTWLAAIIWYSEDTSRAMI